MLSARSAFLTLLVGSLCACRGGTPPAGERFPASEVEFRSARIRPGEPAVVPWIRADARPGSPVGLLGGEALVFDDRDGDGELDADEALEALAYRGTWPAPLPAFLVPERRLPSHWTRPRVRVRVETTHGPLVRAWALEPRPRARRAR